MNKLTPLSVSWGEFGSSLTSALQVFIEEIYLVDVTLIAEGRSYSAHKIVLSAASPIFSNLLKDISPYSDPVITLDGISAKILQILLEFIYRGEITVDSSQIDSLIEAATWLKIQGLDFSSHQTSDEKEVLPSPKIFKLSEKIALPLEKIVIMGEKSPMEEILDVDSEKYIQIENSSPSSVAKRPNSNSNLIPLDGSDDECSIIEERQCKRQKVKDDKSLEVTLEEQTINDLIDLNTNQNNEDIDQKDDSPQIECDVHIVESPKNLMQFKIKCRTVRIGSYKCVPKKCITFTDKGLQLNVPHLKDRTKSATIDIDLKEITQVKIHAGKIIPSMFIDTTTTAAEKIREVLGMVDPNGQYFNPNSPDPSQKKITLLAEKSFTGKKILLFTLFDNKITELNGKAANNILLKIKPPINDYQSFSLRNRTLRSEDNSKLYFRSKS